VELAIRAPWAESVAAFPFVSGPCIVRPVAAEAWTPETERALVVRAKSGDRNALGLILTRYGPTLYRTVLLPRLGNAAAAEQALGDAYARAIERIGSFEWQGTSIYPWLRTVALHVAIDLLRARRRELLFEPEDLQRELEASEKEGSGEGLTEMLAAKRDLDAARLRLTQALDGIHPRYATAIRLRIIEERPREEVAESLGISTATFDVVLHRAMTALRKAMASGQPTGETP
jgi:RNA polymerase sigma-70 factor (ECF subfamily)